MNHSKACFMLILLTLFYGGTGYAAVPMCPCSALLKPCKPVKFADRLSISYNRLISSQTNKTVIIKGTNWFGFNVGQTSVDGLWAGGTSFATDFYAIVYKLHLLGFNAVRLPFTFTDLKLSPLSKAIKCSSLPLGDILRRTVAPADGDVNLVTMNGTRQYSCPSFPDMLPTVGSACNTALVNTTTLERFIQTIDAFVSMGMYVVLDYHPMGTEEHARNVATFSRAWASLWKAIKDKNPQVQGRVLLDIMNEPDSMSIGWTKNKKGQPGFTDLALGMMDNIYKYDKDTLYLVEGTGQTQMRLNWGDGFVTDPDIVKRFKIDDASEFFERLSIKPYKNNLIISPHLYGPTISNNRVTSSGAALFERLNASFGYLYSRGYCTRAIQPKECMVFPIIIGEFGSFFKDAGDIHFFEDMVKFMKTTLEGNAGWMFWTYNANSGDTGGLVTDDWQDMDWRKLRWLNGKLGLKPWYKQ